MYTGIIVTHGTMAQCLIRTLEKVTGGPLNLYPFSNEGKDPDGVVNEIKEKINIDPEIPQFVFCEFVGGSTWFAANKYANERKNTFVLTGVNLPMLISFATKQNDIPPEELANLLQVDANRGITLRHYPRVD